jgi:hypothetical protein
MIPRVHRLVRLGYDRLNPRRYIADEETAITGDLAEVIAAILESPTASWMRFYSIYDDPPENQPKRRGQSRRRGKSRRRVDIRFDSSEITPRTRFRFECKRLAGRGHTESHYLGPEGLGCFLSSEYASEDARAGMLGYVQADDEDTWASRIERRLTCAASEYAVRAELAWRRERFVDGPVHTFRSKHGRGRGRRPIEIYHTLLRFC